MSFRSFRLSLRFILPLAIVLVIFAYAAVRGDAFDLSQSGPGHGRQAAGERKR